MASSKFFKPVGAVVLLLLIFGVPAVLVPVTMDNVPERSKIRALTLHQQAVDIVNKNFEHHNNPSMVPGRLAPLPRDAMAWIKLINPMGRQAPGGGQAYLFNADDETGAIGIDGDQHSVTITLPAYSGLQRQHTVITRETAAP